jgi:protein-S-isoprenylcysteine O-methyltransferase Ste14
MDGDSIFRWVMLAGFLGVVAVTLPHRIKSAREGGRERLDRSKEGVFILATLRPAAAALWLAVIAWMIQPSLMSWSSWPLPAGLRWSGTALCAMSIALLAWALPWLGTNLTDTVVTRERHTLVTNGPYRWVRHPFYDAMALVTLGAALLAANWFILLMGVIVFSLLALRSNVEERQLLARFGEPYREYRARTGRFVPRF